MRIVHLSDPHFGTEQPQVCDALLERISELVPDLVVLSGDITQRATASQFDSAHRFVARLPEVPVLVAPGNHDIPLWDLGRRIFSPYGRFSERFTLPPFAWSDKGVQLLALNSAPRWRHRNGELALGRLSKQLNELTRTPARHRIALFHHPVDCRRHQDRHNVIRDAEGICRVLNDYGVDLVMGGHIHDPLMRTSEHLYPSLQPTLVFLLAGTCVSSRTRVGAPNSFNLIDIRRPGQEMMIERWDMERNLGEFHPVQLCQFLKTETGWVLGEAQRPDHPDRRSLPVS
ncbi:metallophosphoesterase [Marinobacterium sp. D7]|uniref:metallophosphoesterase family protein n=1 Tax=Marinobacterium ramblicola TaxID=2849041 RepID=UPI001C2D20B6|nr:metallophosphoesterase [Marinobacterium ramblicola]MBV1787984.1 metallophosphoesterase [Marinobacterium ramblicola]